MNSGILKALANYLVLNAEQTVSLAAKFKAQSIKKAQTFNNLERGFYIGDALNWPIVEHALDDVCVVAV